MQTAPSQKKPFKFQSWMAGALIVPFGLFMIGRGLLLRGSVEPGKACAQRDECKAPADSCLEVNGKSVCSMSCTDSCPNGLSCTTMNLSMDVGTRSTEIKDARYCLPAELVSK